MIRIDYGPRLIKTLRRLGPEIHAETEKRLRQIAAGFGNPHQHGGLGLRKLGRRSYEARLSLHWRLVLVHHQDRLLAYDVMDHKEVDRRIHAK